MANFFIAIATYPDSHKETFEGRLWLLGGIKDEEGHALLDSLKTKYLAGEIENLSITYES